MAKGRKTPYALKEVATGEIHYFDYPIDKKEALYQRTEDGRDRFEDVSPSKIINPRGEEVFPRRVTTTQGIPIEVPKPIVDENVTLEDVAELEKDDNPRKRGRKKKENVEVTVDEIKDVEEFEEPGSEESEQLNEE